MYEKHICHEHPQHSSRQEKLSETKGPPGLAIPIFGTEWSFFNSSSPPPILFLSPLFPGGGGGAGEQRCNLRLIKLHNHWLLKEVTFQLRPGECVGIKEEGGG